LHQKLRRSEQAASCKEDESGGCKRIERSEGSRENYRNEIFSLKLYDSKYCMKGNPKVVTQALKTLKTESAMRDALKNNIYIRTKEFGRTQYHIMMIHNWCNRSIHELLEHLRMIL
jgi:hypothetical protein